MEYHNSLTNVDPQDDHESEIITSDSATDFAAENVPPTGPVSAPADALGNVNEEPTNSAETLTDATINRSMLPGDTSPSGRRQEVEGAVKYIVQRATEAADQHILDGKTP